MIQITNTYWQPYYVLGTLFSILMNDSFNLHNNSFYFIFTTPIIIFISNLQIGQFTDDKTDTHRCYTTLKSPTARNPPAGFQLQLRIPVYTEHGYKDTMIQGPTQEIMT